MRKFKLRPRIIWGKIKRLSVELILECLFWIIVSYMIVDVWISRGAEYGIAFLLVCVFDFVMIRISKILERGE